jgi:hypothetical protein
MNEHGTTAAGLMHMQMQQPHAEAFDHSRNSGADRIDRTKKAMRCCYYKYARYDLAHQRHANDASFADD